MLLHRLNYLPVFDTPNEGGGGTPPADPPGGTPPAGTPPADAPWYDGVTDEHRGVIEAKSWGSLDDAIKSYRALETTLRGGTPENMVRIPEEGDTDGWNALLTRLGRPENADGYDFGLPDTVPADDPLISWFRGAAHEAGMSNGAASQIIKSFQEHLGGVREKADGDKQLQGEQDLDALQTEWGAAYAEKETMARNAAKQFGLNAEQLDSIEDAIGTAELMRTFANIGAALGEDTIVTTEETTPNEGALSPEAAKVKINELYGDEAFAKKLNNKSHPEHKAAVDRLAFLNGLAYPES